MGSVLPIGVGILIFAFMFHFAITSLRERERRAARMAFLLSLLLPLPYILVGSFAWEYREQLSVGLLSLTGLIVLLLVLPIRWGVRPKDDTPRIRIDERDTMFSRDRLIPGSERFESYYADNPHKRRLDDRFRSQPGLLKEGSRYYDPVLCAAADATFTTVEKLRPSVEGPTSERRNILDPAAMTRFVKRWAVKLGAVSAGVTELRDYHLYSRWGGVRTTDSLSSLRIPTQSLSPWRWMGRCSIMHLWLRPSWSRPSSILPPASSPCRSRTSFATWDTKLARTSTATTVLFAHS